MQQLLGRGIWEVREILLSADLGAEEGDSGADVSEGSPSLGDTVSTG
jgi:hypothetical protein